MNGSGVIAANDSNDINPINATNTTKLSLLTGAFDKSK